MKEVFDSVRVVHVNYDDSIRFEFVYKKKSFLNNLIYGGKCDRTWSRDGKQVFVPANLNDFVTALSKTVVNNKEINVNHYYKGCLLSMDTKTHSIPYNIAEKLTMSEFIDVAYEKFDEQFESEDHKFGFKMQCKNILRQMGVELSEKSTKTEEVKEEQPKENFVSDISLYEFENVNWFEFGRLLKQNKILPNSYIKRPTRVVVKQGKNGKPMVLVTFNSETSDSVREFMLLQDKAYQYVNGSINNNANEELNNVWFDFRNNIRRTSELNLKKESWQNTLKAEDMMNDAKKMMGYKNIYELEQSFLQKYQNVKFDDFTWFTGRMSGETIPAFIPLLKEPINGKFRGEPVVPFSPRTLEFCILHMTDGEMIDHGEYVNDFEAMCREIQEFSCFESKDWDRVIAIGKDIVKNKHEESLSAEK